MSNPIAAAVAPVADEINTTFTVAVTEPVTLSIPPYGAPYRSWYAINNKAAADEAEIRIYEDIGLFGISAKSFSDDLETVEAKTIHVRLNTYGGDAFDGITIHNSLKAHPAKVVIHVDGIAASAGSIIAMSGDEIRMADNAFLMIHEARGGVMGEAGDMRKYADTLDKLNDAIAGTYQQRAGKTRKHWRKKMAEETWYSAEEAKAEGIADTIDQPQKTATNRFDFKVYNQVQHLPEAVARIWGKTPNPAPEASPCGDVPPVSTKETPNMADTPTAAPAQAPVVAAPIVASADPIQKLTAETITSHRNSARVEGVSEGIERERARMRAIVEACPGDHAMAVDSFLCGHDPSSVKLAYDAAKRMREKVEAAAEAQKKADAFEIARLNSLVAAGGHPGVAMSAGRDENDTFSGMTPKAQAEWEWENRPSVRKTASSKDIYVLARSAELDGTHRSFTRAPVQA